MPARGPAIATVTASPIAWIVTVTATVYPIVRIAVQTTHAAIKQRSEVLLGRNHGLLIPSRDHKTFHGINNLQHAILFCIDVPAVYSITIAVAVRSGGKR
jgi:hypothetical protein